jgi:hypothetical protein
MSSTVRFYAHTFLEMPKNTFALDRHKDWSKQLSCRVGPYPGIHELQYLNFGAAGLVFTKDIHELQYLNFGAAGLVFTKDIHELQ